MTELADNPRHLHYARVHGRTSAAQLAEDRVRWPGGSMCGFSLWTRARHAEFHRLRPDAYMMGGSGTPVVVDHAAFDEWLAGLPEGHGLADADPRVGTAS